MKKEKTIYDLKMNEEMEVECDTGYEYVRRVPGGWIFKSIKIGGLFSSDSISNTFVPFKKE